MIRQPKELFVMTSQFQSISSQTVLLSITKLVNILTNFRFAVMDSPDVSSRSDTGRVIIAVIPRWTEI